MVVTHDLRGGRPCCLSNRWVAGCRDDEMRRGRGEGFGGRRTLVVGLLGVGTNATWRGWRMSSLS